MNMNTALNQLSVQAQRKATDKILESMNDILTGNQLLELNRVLNDEFNKVDFISKNENNDEWEEENDYFIRQFLNAKTVEGCSKRTLIYYNSELRKLEKYVTDSFGNLEAEDIRQYLSHYKSINAASNETLNNIRRVFSSFFGWLNNNGYIVKNPMTRIKKIKTTKKVKKAFTLEELELLRENIGKKDYRLKAAFEILLSSGVRISELTNMKIRDIDWDEMTFKVLGKGNKERTCYFNDKSKFALKRYLEHRKDLKSPKKYPDSEYVWVSSKDPYKRLNNTGMRRTIRELGEKAKVKDTHPHRFRRTCASIYLQRGMPIEQVQKILGHESINTTMIYLDMDKDAVKLSHQKYSN